MLKQLVVLTFFLLTFFGNAFAQRKLSGIISDEYDIPIPGAKVFMKNDVSMRTVCSDAGYYELFLLPGEYYLIIRTVGYEDREVFIGMGDLEQTRNVTMIPLQGKSFDEVEIVTKRRNPGRDIIMKVVEKRDSINPWKYPHSCEVYIKSVERLQDSEKTIKKREKKEKKEPVVKQTIDDPFAEQRKADQEFANSMNLLEVQLTRFFEPYNKVKEIRNAYDLRGNADNMYYTTTVKSNFNFFQNLVLLDDLHQTPISSPISAPGILSYKYRLVEQYVENGQKIHKIQITSRSSSTSTLDGYIWVIDSLWLVQKLEFTMNKGNLIIYDYFNISQEFDHPGDSLCVLKHQILKYGVTYNKESTHLENDASFYDYNFDISFGKKYFNNELSVTEKEAYKKDSVYWSDNRKGVFSIDELRYIIVQDSIRDYHNRKEYLDSLDKEFNKITVMKVLWFGMDHRNREKKYQLTFSSLVTMARPIYIAGPRVAPNVFFFKKWDDERTLDSYSEISMGFLNADLKGSSWWRYRYDPFHFGTIAAEFEHDFGVVTWNDAITEVYKRENFYEKTALTIVHNYELFNGFYLNNSVEFAERRSIDKYKFVKKYDNILPNTEAKSFPSYQAMIATAQISYTPGQRYMREPNRKVLLGSKWPTFYAYYERGIPKIFGSDVDHEYVRIGIEQTFKIGTLGTTSYHANTGKFLSSKALYDADYKYFRRSDPIWFSDPLNSFQGLDTSMPTKKLYLAAHIIHHDNGAILNKLPFMKKARIGLVGGGALLYVPEHKWLHYEALVGLERVFKLSKRRLRIGIYCAFSSGNHSKPRTDWKISFALLDNRNLKWNF